MYFIQKKNVSILIKLSGEMYYAETNQVNNLY
jgi:hypothetical protein